MQVPTEKAEMIPVATKVLVHVNVCCNCYVDTQSHCTTLIISKNELP